MDDRAPGRTTDAAAAVEGTGFVCAGGTSAAAAGEAALLVPRRPSETRLDVALSPRTPGDGASVIATIDLPTASVKAAPGGGWAQAAVRSASGALVPVSSDAPPVELEPGDTVLVGTRPAGASIALRYEPWASDGAGSLREHLRASPAEAVRVREAFERFCAERLVPEPVAHDVALALQEALDNVVEHAYRGLPRGVALVEADVTPGGEVVVVVRDRGVEFDPGSAPAPDTTPSLEERRVGGLGILLVRALVDEMRHERRGGENRLVLVKRLPSG